MVKKAFTLAEVLITLGIIGVVAALTIPTVINKVQLKVLQTQFKKTLSVMSSAIEMARLESDYSLRCNETETADCQSFNNLFESQFKVIKVCPNSPYSEGCITGIKGLDTVTPDENSTKDISALNMYYESPIKSRYAFVTSGGFTVVYYHKRLRSLYLIDTNGLRGPNKWGYDVFSLSLNNENTKLYCTTKLGDFFEEGGRGCIDMITGK